MIGPSIGSWLYQNLNAIRSNAFQCGLNRIKGVVFTSIWIRRCAGWTIIYINSGTIKRRGSADFCRISTFIVIRVNRCNPEIIRYIITQICYGCGYCCTSTYVSLLYRWATGGPIINPILGHICVSMRCPGKYYLSITSCCSKAYRSHRDRACAKCAFICSYINC